MCVGGGEGMDRYTGQSHESAKECKDAASLKMLGGNKCATGQGVESWHAPQASARQYASRREGVPAARSPYDTNLLDLLRELTRGRENKRLAVRVVNIYALQDRNGERARLARTRLGLGNHVLARNDGDDCALLNGRRLLKAVRCKRSVSVQQERVEAAAAGSR